MTNEEPKMCTTSGRPVDVVRAEQSEPTGQYKDYIVLCPDERAKGFARPYRDTYRHVGVRPKYPTRPLTEEERERYAPFDYVLYEEYPPDSHLAGRFWKQRQLDSGCNWETKMGSALAETYARDPSFYGTTFCVGCNQHFPVEEFVWTADGETVGS